MTKTSVAARTNDSVVSIPRERVYFPFASGRFAYNCHECGAQCCRGHGYDLHSGVELQVQLRTRPAIKLFLDGGTESRPNYFTVASCPPTCFFLAGDGQCSIQTQHGYNAKPETCRFFPFNYIHLVGHYVVVAPHPALCPLDVMPAGSQAKESDHDWLFENMAAQGMNAEVPRWPGRGNATTGIIESERSLVARSEHYLSSAQYLPFALDQLLALPTSMSPHAGNLATERPSLSALECFARTVAELLGVPPDRCRQWDPNVVRVLIATTPVIRAELILGRDDVRLDQVPYLLIALGIIAGLAVDAGMQTVTYQTVLRLFTSYLPLLVMLSLLERHIVWHDRALIPFACGRNGHQASYIRIARALLPSASHSRRYTLSQILEREVRWDGLERLSFLKNLSRCISGRVGVVDHRASRPPRLLRGIRPVVQRIALRLLGDSLLTAVANRQSSGVITRQSRSFLQP